MRNTLPFDDHAFRVAMAQAGFRSLSRFAHRAGLSDSYAQHIVSGLYPSPEMQLRIASILGVTVEVLWHVR